MCFLMKILYGTVLAFFLVYFLLLPIISALTTANECSILDFYHKTWTPWVGPGELCGKRRTDSWTVAEVTVVEQLIDEILTENADITAICGEDLTEFREYIIEHSLVFVLKTWTFCELFKDLMSNHEETVRKIYNEVVKHTTVICS